MRVKRVTDPGGTPVTTVYIYSGTKVIAEYVGGTLDKEYIYLGSTLLATIDKSVSPDVVTYHHKDHLSVRVNTDSTGASVGEQGHYPFGEDWDSSSTTNKWGFTNYERESAAELNYATFRYDSSRLGRFMTPDTLAGSIANPQSLNRYGYVVNDPINLVDPLGLDHEWVQACNPDGTGCIWVPLMHDPIKVSVSIDGGGGGGGVGGNPSGCVDIYVEGFYAGNTCQQGGMRVSEAGRGGGLLGGGVGGGIGGVIGPPPQPPVDCEQRILDRVNNKFDTNFTTSDVDTTYTAGGGFNIVVQANNLPSAQFNNVQPTSSPTFWAIFGFGSTLHVPRTRGGEKVFFKSNIGTGNSVGFVAHTDHGSHFSPIGGLVHIIVDVAGSKSRHPCPK